MDPLYQRFCPRRDILPHFSAYSNSDPKCSIAGSFRASWYLSMRHGFKFRCGRGPRPRKFTIAVSNKEIIHVRIWLSTPFSPILLLKESDFPEIRHLIDRFLAPDKTLSSPIFINHRLVSTRAYSTAPQSEKQAPIQAGTESSSPAPQTTSTAGATITNNLQDIQKNEMDEMDREMQLAALRVRRLDVNFLSSSRCRLTENLFCSLERCCWKTSIASSHLNVDPTLLDRIRYCECCILCVHQQ
jgi:hypothetical protein